MFTPIFMVHHLQWSAPRVPMHFMVEFSAFLFMENIGSMLAIFGEFVYKLEHKLFQQVDYVGPIYDIISYVGTCITLPTIQARARHKSHATSSSSSRRKSTNYNSKHHRFRSKGSCSSGRAGRRGRNGCRHHHWWKHSRQSGSTSKSKHGTSYNEAPSPPIPRNPCSRLYHTITSSIWSWYNKSNFLSHMYNQFDHKFSYKPAFDPLPQHYQ